MKRTWAVILGVGAAWCCGSSFAAAQGLNQQDRLLFYYYNYYVAQQNTNKIVNQQKQLNTTIQQNFRQAQNSRASQIDPIERYVREGRGLDPQTTPLPPIYSGGGQRQYFMRIRYFNPPQRQQ